MLTLITDMIVTSILLYLGIAHPEKHPLLQQRAVKISLAALAILVAGAWFYWQKVQEDQQIELRIWDFAVKSNEHDDYCTYLKDYPSGLFIKDAQKKCNAAPKQIAVTTPPVNTTITTPIVEIRVSPPVASPTFVSVVNHYELQNGIVKDTQTGLIWMRCSLGLTWNGTDCEGTPISFAWQQAMQQNNSSYAGFSDWRLPTRDELRGLIYCSSEQQPTDKDGRWFCDGDFVKPTIHTEVFLNTPVDDWYWTSTPIGADIWIVDFNKGVGYWSRKSAEHYVRLVRNAT